MPRGHPLVLPPPYEYRRVGATLFLVRADSTRLARALPESLRPAPGFARRLLIAGVDNREVACTNDPTGSLYSYKEIVLAAVVSPRERHWDTPIGLYPLVVYVDDDTALAVGREVYGFAKKMAEIEVGSAFARLRRKGRLETTAGEQALVPIDLLDIEWRKRASPATIDGSAHVVLRKLLSMGIFNELALPPTAGAPSDDAPHTTLTWIKPSGVRTEQLRWLTGIKLRVQPSVTDPIWRLLGREPGVTHGLRLDFCFSIGEGRVLEEVA